MPKPSAAGNITALSTFSTLAVIHGEDEADRQALAADLLRAADALEQITADTPDGAAIEQLILKHTGRHDPDHVALAATLADYYIRFAAGADPQPYRAVQRAIAAGVRRAATPWAGIVPAQ